MSDDVLLDELANLDARLRRLEGGSTASPATSWEELYSITGEILPGRDGHLRTADLAAATIAGLAGGLLDLRASVTTALTSEEFHQRIDAAFKAKAKLITGESGTLAIDNSLGGPDHRMLGPTHDLFRLFSAINGVRSGRFEAVLEGALSTRESYRAGLPPYLKVESASDALVLLLIHWSADFFSARSLPIPGWSKLAEIDSKEWVQGLMRAYREGANLRAMVSQFVNNLSGLALMSILLHVYRYIDLFWITERRPVEPAALGLSGDLRFRWMSRNANLTALTVSTANVAVTNNFFSWNYMSFCRFYADAKAVERLLDARHVDLDARTDQMLKSLGER